MIENRSHLRMPDPATLNLPDSVGAWSRSPGARRIGRADIFRYMDGSGELYLGYGFLFLDVWQYNHPNEGGILVETYRMPSSDDAYGLLSGDWGGEAIAPGSGARALYGAGLLRLWSGDVYARVMADLETGAARKAVMELGRAIVAGRTAADEPELVRALPVRVGARFRLLAERTMFLRSHLVLNSAYFLSCENLLDLGPGCEAVAAAYADADEPEPGKAVRLLLVRYADAEAARAALRHFRSVYLPGLALASGRGAVEIEDGWTGFEISGQRTLVLTFEARDEPGARLLMEHATRALRTLEVIHG
jgi:hypothetical protein